MKKNAMLKIAAVLMVAVLLTTCAISSTFAKYTTTANPTAMAQATVANWGIKITTDTPTLFKTSYSYGEGAANKVYAAAATNGNLILAPGTKNSATDAFVISIEGSPEVRFALTADVDVTLANWVGDSNGTYYCPVKFYVNGTQVATAATAPLYEKNIENAIAAAIFGDTNINAAEGTTTYTKEYAPNAVTFGTPVKAEEPDGAKNNSVCVTWAWDFNGDNTKDTYLGNAENKATVDFEYSITAEQVAVNHAE